MNLKKLRKNKKIGLNNTISGLDPNFKRSYNLISDAMTFYKKTVCKITWKKSDPIVGSLDIFVLNW